MAWCKQMSASASQATAFYRQVAKNKKVWTIRDANGLPAPKGTDGIRTQPFWSSQSRAEMIIKRAPAYAGFKPVEISWIDFTSRWIPGLSKDGFNIGINWAGSRATGYDLKPDEVLRNVEALLANTAAPSVQEQRLEA
jgi:hypothetical protein